jgi:hypothetical protein
MQVAFVKKGSAELPLKKICNLVWFNFLIKLLIIDFLQEGKDDIKWSQYVANKIRQIFRINNTVIDG